MGGPLIKDKALILILKNPAALFDATPALEFDAPVELNLGKRGIRRIEYAPKLKAYLIVAGPSGGSGDLKLYKWSGKAAARPEALAVDIPDDGDDCNPQAPKFRSFTFTVAP